MAYASCMRLTLSQFSHIQNASMLGVALTMVGKHKSLDRLGAYVAHGRRARDVRQPRPSNHMLFHRLRILAESETESTHKAMSMLQYFASRLVL
tara:strand:+ start:134529 stop:134810 length:282 start_codon:yes stop_codon:yes gene_type:complete